MLRLIFRFFGLILLAAGFAALVVDGARSIASNRLTMASIGKIFADISPTKFLAMQTSIERRFGVFVWESVLSWPLALPAWVAFGALGLLLLLLTNRRRRLIGASSRS